MNQREIRIRVKFMSGLADLVGCPQLSVGLPSPARLADLVADLGVQLGQPLAARLEGDPADPFGYHVVAIVDGQIYPNPSASEIGLADGATVVFMEPVAGGAGVQRG